MTFEVPSLDPTAIDLRVDPRAQRIEGVTTHGGIHFSVPYVSQIDETLWVGGCADGLVLPREIVHVVSLYPWEQYELHENVRSALTVKMLDADVPPGSLIWRIAEWVNDCRDDGPTLVHCQAGLNRSCLIAACAIEYDLHENGEGFLGARGAIDLLREKRSRAVLCNRAFERWLLAGERS
jgi:protein-tyrosine phosphatase